MPIFDIQPPDISAPVDGAAQGEDAGGYIAPQKVAGLLEEKLKAGGFNEAEIAGWRERKRSSLSAAGFSDIEVGSYLGENAGLTAHLKGAGFSDVEILDFTKRKRPELEASGFTRHEIDAYFSAPPTHGAWIDDKRNLPGSAGRKLFVPRHPSDSADDFLFRADNHRRILRGDAL